MLNIAIYSRKSIYSDTSDSVDAQYNMCADYCKSHYKDINLVKYTDEGYTGANVNRPSYEKMLEDINDGLISIVVCYKIDRISRNVSDFSKFFNHLSELNVQFVSIKEQIDTSSPLGRAMMYICTVFAQMERETIAERIKDNLIELAKSGKWAGGPAPLGYNLKHITISGKKHTALTPNPENIPFLKMVFDTFVNGNYSLSGLETHFKKNGIKSINGNFLSASQLWGILKNPLYAPADSDTYNYFTSLGCKIHRPKEDFDGTHALMVYSRTSEASGKHINNPPEKWIITIGLHEPLLTSEVWLAAQSRFGKNSIDKTRKHKIGILKGVLRCSCGKLMCTKYKYDKQYNVEYKHYFCRVRIYQGIEYCSTPLAKIETLDNIVINILKSIKLNKELIDDYISNDQKTTVSLPTRKEIEKKIKSAQLKISNLTTALTMAADSAAAKYIIAEIEKCDQEIAGYKYSILEIEKNEKYKQASIKSKEEKYNVVCKIVDSLNSANYDETNSLICNLFKSCVWDGKSLKITL